MRKSILFTSTLFFILTSFSSYSQTISEPFEFEFENKKLKGLIEKPKNKKSKAVVLIIPGYGKTNFVNGRSFYNLRSKLVSLGLTVISWDKMGCGNSEGVFDAQQPVENSAEEANAAIQKIKALKIPGHEKIGLWGISRAGWICPLIHEKYPIAFWISVSGTNDKENFGYLLKSNLLIHGKSEKEAERLYNSWMLNHKIFSTLGSYKESLVALRPIMQDSLSRKLFGYKNVTEVTEEGKKKYLQNQKSYANKGHFDKKTGLWVYIDNFDQLLQKINIPVLALFGENDSQVDWQATKKLYEKTIGLNLDSELTIKTFKNCNHSLQKCQTCAYREDLSELGWKACDSYYEEMETWLRNQQLIN